MPVTMVTVTWDELDIGGAGLTGSIRFLLSSALSDSTTGAVYEPDARSYSISGGTGQTVPIVPNDSSELSPTGTYYTITIAIAGQTPRVLTKFVNSAAGTTQKLASLPDAVPLAAAPLALPLPSGGPPTANEVPLAVGDGTDSTVWGSVGAASLPLTTLGDLLFENATPAPARLPGNTTATRKFLRQQGAGTVSAAPVWDTLVAGDIPSLLASYDAAGAAAAVQALALLKSGGTMTGALIPKVVTLTDAATVAIDASQGNQFVLTATAGVGATRQLGTPANPVDGQQILFDFIQDSAGSRGLTFSAAYDFGAGGAPTSFSTGANKIDTLGFRYKASISKWTYLNAAFPQGF